MGGEERRADQKEAAAAASAVDVFSKAPPPPLRWLCSQTESSRAARVGDFDLVGFLLQALAETVLEESAAGVMLAASGDDTGTLEAGDRRGREEALMENINQRDPVTGQRPLHIAAHQGNRPAVRALLLCGADVNATACPYSPSSDTTPIPAVSSSPSYNDSCFPPRALLRGMTALHWASLRGSREIVQDLIGSGADLGARVPRTEETALHLAARCGRQAVVASLLDAGSRWSDSNSSGLTPVDLAARSNHRGTLSEFLARGIDPAAVKNSLGYSPLHQAAYHNCSDTLRLLLESGGDANAKTSAGYTPLHVAAFSAHPPSSVPAIPAAAASAPAPASAASRAAFATTSSTSNAAAANIATAATATAFAEAKAVTALRTLAQHGGSGLLVDAVDAHGATPLRTACVYLRSRAVRELLDIGADPDLVKDLSSPDSFVKGFGAAAAAADGARQGDIARILEMLAAARADRAWSRRGWLAIVRARRTAAVAAALYNGSRRSSGGCGGRSGAAGAPPTPRKRFPPDAEGDKVAAAAASGKACLVDGAGAKRGDRGGSAAQAAESPSSDGQPRLDIDVVVRKVTALEDEALFKKIVLFL